MRPWKPASSSGRAPPAAIAAMLSRIAAGWVAMSNSIRTTSAPSDLAAMADSRVVRGGDQPGLKRPVVKRVDAV